MFVWVVFFSSIWLNFQGAPFQKEIWCLQSVALNFSTEFQLRTVVRAVENVRDVHSWSAFYGLLHVNNARKVIHYVIGELFKLIFFICS